MVCTKSSQQYPYIVHKLHTHCNLSMTETESSEAPAKKSFWGKKKMAFIKNFPFNATDEEITNFLSVITDFKSFKRVMSDDKERPRWTGSILASFKSDAGVLECMLLHDSMWTDGRVLAVEEFNQKKSKSRGKQKRSNKHSIFVGNLGDSSEEDIMTIFKKAMGPQSRFYLRLAFTKEYEDKPKTSRGFGHIEFDELKDKEKALTLMGNVKLDNGELIKIRNPMTPEQRKKEEDKKREAKEEKRKRRDSKRKFRGNRKEGKDDKGKFSKKNN